MTNFNEIFDRKGTNCWKWDAEGKGATYAMGTADMDFKIARPIADALHKKIDEGALTYLASCMPAFKALSAYSERHYGIEFKPEHVCNSVGLMVALRVLLDAFTNPGDGLIIQSPVFNYFNDTAENIGRKIFDNQLIYHREEGKYSIDFHDLEEKASNPRAKMMLICNPSNPISRGYTLNELNRIYDICERNNVILVSDEIHSDFYFNGFKHHSVLSLTQDKANNCIMLTGTGKTFNIHGFYTAFVVIPNDSLREQYNVSYANIRLEAIDLGLVAAEAAYTSCDDYVYELRDYIEKNVNYLQTYFKNHDIKVKAIEMEATYLAWLDFKEWGLSSEELFVLFKSKGIIMTKGAQFGHDCDGFMRLNIATQLQNVIEVLEIVKDIYEEMIVTP